MPVNDYKSGISHWKAGTKPEGLVVMQPPQPENCPCKWDYHGKDWRDASIQLKFINRACPIHGEGKVYEGSDYN